MPVPTNQTPATALPMSLNYALTLEDVDLATPNNCDVWWSYTAVAGDTVVGFCAYDVGAVASYTPTTTVWTGPVGSLVAVLPFGAGATDVPLQVPVTPGNTYYFRVRNSSGVAPAAGTSVAISALRASNLTAPVGSILVNDDTPGLPAVILSAADGSALQFINDFPAGEEGDTNAAGSLLIYDTDTGDIKLYTVTGGALEAPTTIALNVEAIRLNPTSQTWWTATQDNPATIRSVDAGGSIGATIWTLTHNSVFGLAVNPDESIAYYSQRTSGSAIHTFDLGPSTPGADLAAGIGAAYVRDILIPADGNIIASYVLIGTGEVTVLRYSPAGAVLNTYGPYSSDIPGGTQPRLAYGTTGTFWLWRHENDASFFLQIDIATGATLLTVEAPEYEFGVYQGAPTPTPTRFGNSFSCPFIVTTASITGTESPTPTPPDPDGGGGYSLVTHTRRRVRVFPVLSEEMVRAFHKSLTIDMETGVGVTDPDAQGHDPLVMLRHSDDGGHTWSSVKTRSLGKAGEYGRFVRYGPLGQARQRTYELSTSEPVRTNLIGGYLDAEAGVS
jgi:hypothetical protein